MATSEADIKRLWGNAAGICSRPGCGTDCVPIVASAGSVVVGEMAHVIAQSPKGPRGAPAGGDDSYENLILLCPTCHRLVDKAPVGTFPRDLLHQWKRDQEARRQELAVAVFDSRTELGTCICALLAENRAAWRQYGPESETARANPLSNMVDLWDITKVAYLVPRNAKIVQTLKANSHLLDMDEYDIALRFAEHARGFEANCYKKLDGVPRFPVEFEEMMRRAAQGG